MFLKFLEILNSSTYVLKKKLSLQNKSIFTMFAISANCEEKKHCALLPNAHESLKYACLLNVNSASSVLTTIFCAIDDTGEKYKESLAKLTSKLEDCILLNGWNDELWESVIVLRNEMDGLKMELQNLKSSLEVANKIVSSAIELSFQINASNLCSTLCEFSCVVEEKLKIIDNEIKQKEKIYLASQIEVAKNHKIDNI